MDLFTFLIILLPVVLAFAVLYYIDPLVERRIDQPAVAAVLEIFIALVILIFGLGFAISILL